MTTKEKWNNIISAKLIPGQTLDDLKTTYDSNIVMDPNIVSDEVSHLDHSITLSDPWINMAHISADTARDLNRLALLSLDQGANGLSLALPKGSNVKAVLSGVLTEYLQVRLICNGWTAEDITQSQLSCGPDTHPNLTWIGVNHRQQINIGSSDRIAQIRAALDQIQTRNKIDLVISIGKDILFEISSLRALKVLLQKRNLTDINLIARYDVTGTNMLGDYNLIERTYKVMSAIMGNADMVLTDYTGDEESRLALNIHNVLELESGFKHVHDPIGGAYYVESLVEQIISKIENT